jgi:hypothetical protein
VLTGERYWLAQAICSQVEDGYVSEGVADRLDNPKPRETSSDRQRLYA